MLRYKILISRFFSWFIPILFCLPTTIGGWLIYFGVLSPAGMWIATFIASIIGGVYFTMLEENDEGNQS